MLVGIIADIFERYFEPVNREKISWSFKESQCIIYDCKVKSDTIRKWNLPFKIENVQCDSVEIRYTWKWSLYDTEISFDIKNLNITATIVDRMDKQQIREALRGRKMAFIKHYIVNQLLDAHDMANRSWGSELLANLLRSATLKIHGINIILSDDSASLSDVIRVCAFSCDTMLLTSLDIENKSDSLRKGLYLRGIQVQMDDDPLLSSLDIDCRFNVESCDGRYKIDTNAWLDVEIHHLHVNGISADILWYFSNLFQCVSNFEKWACAPIHPKQYTGVAILRWHAIRIRKQHRYQRLWYPSTDDKIAALQATKAFYLHCKTSNNLQNFVDYFESECPVEMLKDLNLEIARREESSAQYRDVFQRIYTYLNSNNLANEGFLGNMEDHDAQDTVSQSEKFVKWSISIPDISIPLIDEFGFKFCQIEFGFYNVSFRNEVIEKHSMSITKLSLLDQTRNLAILTTRRAKGLRTTEIVRVGDESDAFYSGDEDSYAGSDSEFFFEESDDESPSVPLEDSTIRIFAQNSNTSNDVKVIIEPVEIYWYTEAIENVVKFCGVCFSQWRWLPPENSIPPLEVSLQNFELKLGAPCFVFFKPDEVGTIGSVVDLGALRLQGNRGHVDVKYDGLSVWFAHEKGTRKMWIQGKWIPILALLGPFDVSGAVKITRSAESCIFYDCDFLISTGESITSIMQLHSPGIIMLQDMILAVHAVGETIKEMFSYVRDVATSRQQLELVVNVQMNNAFVSASHEPLSHLLDVRSESLKWSIVYQAGKRQITLTARGLVVEAHESRYKLLQLDDIKLCFDMRKKKLELHTDGSCTITWEPSIANKLRQIFDDEFDVRSKRVAKEWTESVLHYGYATTSFLDEMSVHLPVVQLHLVKDGKRLASGTCDFFKASFARQSSTDWTLRMCLNQIFVMDCKYDVAAYELNPAIVCEPPNMSQGLWCVCVSHSIATQITSCDIALKKLDVVLWQPFFAELHEYVTTGVLGILFRQFEDIGAQSISSDHKGFRLTLDIQESQLRAPCTTLTTYPVVVLECTSGIHVATEKNSERSKVSASIGMPQIFVADLDGQKKIIGKTLRDVNIEIHSPVDVTTEPTLDVYIIAPTMSMSVHEAALLFTCATANLLNNKVILESFLYISEMVDPPEIVFWKSVYERRVPRVVKILLEDISISVDNSLFMKLHSVRFQNRSTFVAACCAFSYTNELSWNGLTVHTDHSVLIGKPTEMHNSPRDTDMQASGTIEVSHDPMQSLWNILLNMDYLQLVVDWPSVQMVKSLFKKIHNNLDEIRGANSNSDGFARRRICMELEFLSCSIWLPGNSHSLRFLISTFGNITRDIKTTGTFIDTGMFRTQWDMYLLENQTHDANCGMKTSSSHDENVMMMSHMFDNSVDLESKRKQTSIEDPLTSFAIDASYEIPVNEPLKAKQIFLQQSSDVVVRLSTEDLYQLKAIVDRQVILHTEEHSEVLEYAVIFDEEPLGLKMGPCESNPSHLEIRGFTNSCEEIVATTVHPGDVLVSVNSISLLDENSLEEVKDILRRAPWPRNIKFRRNLDRHKVDPSQYVPLSQLSWICRNCYSLQPLRKRVIEVSSIQCMLCKAIHTHPNWDARAHTRDVTSGDRIVEEYVLENQRYYMVMGWSSQMLPGDLFSWCNTKGGEVSMDNLGLPSHTDTHWHWVWQDEWTVDTHIGDQNGWIYGDSFVKLAQNPDSRAKAHHSVRQRRWKRKRELRPYTTSEGILDNLEPKTSGDSFLRDLTTVSQNSPSPTDSHLAISYDNANYNLDLIWCHASKVPVVKVRLGSKSWSRFMVLHEGDQVRTIRLAVGLTSDIHVFHQRSMGYEPILDGLQLAAELERCEGKYLFSVFGLSPGRLNLSTSMIQVWKDSQSSSAAQPYPVIHNLTGCALNLFYRDTSSVITDEPFSMESICDATIMPEQLSVKLFGGWSTVGGLHFHRPGDVIFVIDKHMDGEKFTSKLLVNVGHKEKSMTLHSLYRIDNRTGCDISMELTDKSGGQSIMLDRCINHQSAWLPVIEDLESRNLNIIAGKTKPFSVNLGQLTLEAVHACKGNLATAITTGILVEETIMRLDDATCVIFIVFANAIEQCYAPTSTSVTVRHRSTIGKRYSNCVLRMMVAAPIQFDNSLMFDEMRIRVRRKNRAVSLREYSCAPQECVYVTNIGEVSNLEWCICVDRVSQRQWSAWHNFELNATHTIEIVDAHGNRIQLGYSIESLFEGVTEAIRVSFKSNCTFVDHTNLSFEVGIRLADRPASAISGQPSVYSAVLYNFERWHPTRGWTAPFLKGDPGAWCFAGSGETAENLPYVKPLHGWQWVEPEWHKSIIDGSQDSWEYATDFAAESWQISKTAMSCVRRQRWYRASMRENSDIHPFPYAILGSSPTFCLRLGSGPWSEAVSTNDTGTVYVHVEDRCGASSLFVPIALTVMSNNMVVVRNQYCLENDTDVDLRLVHENVSNRHDATLLKRQSSHCNLKWGPVNRRICIGMETDGEMLWSGPFDPRFLDTFDLFLRSEKSSFREILRVTVHIAESTKVFHVKITNAYFPPLYRIDNRTLHTLTALQVTSEACPVMIKDRRSCIWGLDEVGTEREAVIEIIIHSQTKEKVDVSQRLRIDLFKDVHVGSHQKTVTVDENVLVLRMYSEGITKVISISHDWGIIPAPEIVEQTINFVYSIYWEDPFTTTIVDSQELFRARAHGVRISGYTSDILQSLDVLVDELEISDGDIFNENPVVFRSTSDKMCEIRLSKFVRFFHGVHRVKHIDIDIGDCSLCVDSLQYKTLRRLRSQIMQILGNEFQPKHDRPSRIVIDVLQVHSCSILVTLLPKPSRRSDRNARYLSTISNEIEERKQSKLTAMEVLTAVTSRVVSLDDTEELPYWATALDFLLRKELRNYPLQLPTIALGHITEELAILTVADELKISVSRQLAPTLFITQKMSANPFRLNSRSLVGGLSDGLAAVSMNSDLIRNRRYGERQTFMQALREGITGLVTEPILEFRRRGAAGVISGLGRGIASATLRPLIGLLDTYASPQVVTESKSNEELDQSAIRLSTPVYGPWNIVQPFSSDDSLAFEFLKTTQEGLYYNDHLYGSITSLDRLLYIITDKRILCISDFSQINIVIGLESITKFSTMQIDEITWGVHIQYGTKYMLIRCGKNQIDAKRIWNYIHEASKQLETYLGNL